MPHVVCLLIIRGATSTLDTDIQTNRPSSVICARIHVRENLEQRHDFDERQARPGSHPQLLVSMGR